MTDRPSTTITVDRAYYPAFQHTIELLGNVVQVNYAHHIVDVLIEPHGEWAGAPHAGVRMVRDGLSVTATLEPIA